MPQLRIKVMTQRTISMRNYSGYSISSTSTVWKLLGDFNAQLGTEDVCQPTIGSDSSHENSKIMALRVVNFATTKSLIFESTLYLHWNIHQCTWASTMGRPTITLITVWQTGDGIQVSLNVKSFRGAQFGTDQYMVVAKVKDRL
jgi:hypothetical protein